MNDEHLPDGQYDDEVGKHKTVKTIETKISEVDGVEETHVTHDIKQANPWKFSGGR